MPIVRIDRPEVGRRYVVDANKTSAGTSGEQAGSSLDSPKHAPIVRAHVSWAVVVSGRGAAKVSVEFFADPNAAKGQGIVTTGTFPANVGTVPIVHVGEVLTPFSLPDSPVGNGSALTFEIRDVAPGFEITSLFAFLDGYMY